jgi:hypothetical protein
MRWFLDATKQAGIEDNRREIGATPNPAVSLPGIGRLGDFCPRGVTCSNGVISQAIGALLEALTLNH